MTRDHMAAREAVKSKSLTMDNFRRASYAGLLSGDSYSVSDRRKSETVKRRHYSTTEQRKLSYSGHTERKLSSYSTSGVGDRKLSYSSCSGHRKLSYSSTVGDRKLSYSSVGGSSIISHSNSVTVSRDQVSHEKTRLNKDGGITSENEKPKKEGSTEDETTKKSEAQEKLNDESTKPSAADKVGEDSALQAYNDLKKVCMGRDEKNNNSRYAMGLKRYDYNALRKLPDTPADKKKREEEESKAEEKMDVDAAMEIKDEQKTKDDSTATEEGIKKDDNCQQLPAESLKESYWKNKLANYINTGSVKELNIPQLASPPAEKAAKEDASSAEPGSSDPDSSKETHPDSTADGKRRTKPERGTLLLLILRKRGDLQKTT